MKTLFGASGEMGDRVRRERNVLQDYRLMNLVEESLKEIGRYIPFFSEETKKGDKDTEPASNKGGDRWPMVVEAASPKRVVTISKRGIAVEMPKLKVKGDKTDRKPRGKDKNKAGVQAVRTEKSSVVEVGGRRLRLRCANREDVIDVPACLDKLLPADHLARKVWGIVEDLALTSFYANIKVEEGTPGAPAIDPKILVAVWIYATSQGETSAREIDKLRVEHLAYIWLCGGVKMNYHTLSDFRTDYEKEMDELLTQVLEGMIAAGLVDLETQTQDGMRVRASAGAASFRREATLEKKLEQAQERISDLERAEEEQTDEGTARQKAARKRAVREQVERLMAALEELPKVKAAKPAEKREEARVSSTDVWSRVMKMADGGYRPAYNWQFAVELSNYVITGVDVVNTGSDKSQMERMVEQVKQRTGQLPKNWLIDGGFVKLMAIETLDKAGVTVYGPVPEPRDKSRERYAPLPGDSEAVAEWRQRMGTEEGKAMYKQRSLVELPNAQARNRHGIQQVRVRGPNKVRCVALWVAITHNLLIWIRHRQQGASASIQRTNLATA